MPRSTISVCKGNSINGNFTNYKDAIDEANAHNFTPADLTKCIILVFNTTASEETLTIEGLAGGDDIVLTLAAGDGTEQLAVYSCADLDPDLYLQSADEVNLLPSAGMTGWIVVTEVKPDIEITVIDETAGEVAAVELSTLDGAEGYFTPGALEECIMSIRNTLVAAAGANDKYVTVKAGESGIAHGIGDKIVLCPEAAATAILGKDMDSSRFLKDDGTVHIRVEPGMTGTISIVEN